MKQKTEYKKNPASMYVNKTEKGGVIFKLYLVASELPEANDKGVIELIGFKNDYKEKESQPDVRFSLPKPRPSSSGKVRLKQKDTPRQDSDAGGSDWF